MSFLKGFPNPFAKSIGSILGGGNNTDINVGLTLLNRVHLIFISFDGDLPLLNNFRIYLTYHIHTNKLFKSELNALLYR